MNQGMGRGGVKLLAYALGIMGAICYGAYQANPKLAILCAVAVAAAFTVGYLISRHKENQVKQMVADVDAGADRFIAGVDDA